MTTPSERKRKALKKQLWDEARAFRRTKPVTPPAPVETPPLRSTEELLAEAKPRVEEAFGHLLATLEHAADLYEQDAKLGKRWAVFAVLRFLVRTDANSRRMAPLEHLAHDMEPRDRNRMTEYEAFCAAACLAAIQALIDAGHAGKTARGQVSEATGGKFSDTQLETLRKNLPHPKRTNPLVGHWYPFFFAGPQGENAKDKAERLLGVVSSYTSGGPRVLVNVVGYEHPIALSELANE